jgi:hypothetical protein
LSSVAGPSVATILVRLCMAAIIAQAAVDRCHIPDLDAMLGALLRHVMQPP